MTSQKSLVTVFMPHYRCERYIQQAAESILRQSHRELKLCIVDDASSTGEWIEAVRPLLSDTRVSLFHSTQNVGPYRLFNSLLPRIKTPWIAFQDSDDISHPDRFKLQLKYAARTGADIVCSNFHQTDENLNIIRSRDLLPNSNQQLLRGKKFLGLHSTMLVRREVFDTLRGFDGATRFGADTEFLLRASHLFQIRNLRRYLYYYRQRATSLTGNSATGIGSWARVMYGYTVYKRHHRTQQIKHNSRLLRALRAVPNNVEFELHPVEVAAHAGRNSSVYQLTTVPQKTPIRHSSTP